MIADKLTTFSDGDAAGNTGTRAIGNSVDLQATGVVANVGDQLGGLRDAGGGQPIYLQVMVSEAFLFTGTTDHSYTIELVTSANSDLSTPTVLLAGTNPNTTDIAIGTVLLQVALPTEGTAYQRFIGLNEVVVGTTSTGKIKAFLTEDPRSIKTYAQASVGF